MSLLSTLLRAGSELQTALEMKRPPALSSSANQATKARAETPAKPGADRFTHSGSIENDSARKVNKLALADYKKTVGQDLAFIRDTLRHKLAEYNVHPATSININKDAQGSISVNGKTPNPAFGRIAADLNVNPAFSEAFQRLSVNEPTLHFMDNALKLSKAYGVNNSLLSTLISENQQFNGLQDLVHRYDSMRRNADTLALPTANSGQDYAFRFNGHA